MSKKVGKVRGSIIALTLILGGLVSPNLGMPALDASSAPVKPNLGMPALDASIPVKLNLGMPALD